MAEEIEVYFECTHLSLEVVDKLLNEFIPPQGDYKMSFLPNRKGQSVIWGIFVHDPPKRFLLQTEKIGEIKYMPTQMAQCPAELQITCIEPLTRSDLKTLSKVFQEHYDKDKKEFVEFGPNLEVRYRRRKKRDPYGNRSDTLRKFLELLKLHEEKPDKSWTHCCQEVGIDTKTADKFAQKNTPELRANWKTPKYSEQVREILFKEYPEAKLIWKKMQIKKDQEY